MGSNVLFRTRDLTTSKNKKKVQRENEEMHEKKIDKEKNEIFCNKKKTDAGAFLGTCFIDPTPPTTTSQ